MYQGMLNHARYSVKQWKREGRFTAVVSVAQKGWQLRKNLADRMRVRRAIAGVEAQPVGLPLHRWVDLVLNELGGFLKPIQNQYELTRLIELVAARSPSVVLEIGTAKAGTLFLLSKAARADALIVSCDLPGGLYGGGYPRWKAAVFSRLIPHPQTLRLIRGNSHDRATKTEVMEALSGAKVDFLFIDGDHSYAGVKQDFHLYRDLVRPGGLIGFHDILPNRFDADIDVARFWSEVKARYETEEVVEDYTQGFAGIGLVEVPASW